MLAFSSAVICAELLNTEVACTYSSFSVVSSGTSITNRRNSDRIKKARRIVNSVITSDLFFRLKWSRIVCFMRVWRPFASKWSFRCLRLRAPGMKNQGCWWIPKVNPEFRCMRGRVWLDFSSWKKSNDV